MERRWYFYFWYNIFFFFLQHWVFLQQTDKPTGQIQKMKTNSEINSWNKGKLQKQNEWKQNKITKTTEKAMTLWKEIETEPNKKWVQFIIINNIKVHVLEMLSKSAKFFRFVSSRTWNVERIFFFKSIIIINQFYRWRFETHDQIKHSRMIRRWNIELRGDSQSIAIIFMAAKYANIRQNNSHWDSRSCLGSFVYLIMIIMPEIFSEFQYSSQFLFLFGFLWIAVSIDFFSLHKSNFITLSSTSSTNKKNEKKKNYRGENITSRSPFLKPVLNIRHDVTNFSNI